MTDHPNTPIRNSRMLLKHYARDLAQITPSPDLDARIDAFGRNPSADRSGGAGAPPPAALASTRRRPVFAVVAIGVGVFIGMKVEHARKVSRQK